MLGQKHRVLKLQRLRELSHNPQKKADLTSRPGGYLPSLSPLETGTFTQRTPPCKVYFGKGGKQARPPTGGPLHMVTLLMAADFRP